MKRIITSFLGIWALYTTALAQLAIGQWRSHPAFGTITKTCCIESKVFAQSMGNLFSYDNEDNALACYSCETGLSGSYCHLITASPDQKRYIIVYDDSNIDLVEGDKLYNLPALSQKPMITSKTINAVSVYDRYAYAATDFGVLVLNLSKKEIADTYILNKKVLNSIVVKDSLVALTENGIYKGALTDNLLDINNWYKRDNTSGDKLIFYNNYYYLLTKNKGVKQWKNKQWITIATGYFGDIFIANNQLYYYSSRTLYTINKSDKISFVRTNFDLAGVSYSNKEKVFWSNDSKGLTAFKIESGKTTVVKSNILPNGPMLNSAFSMLYSKDRILIAGGGRWGNRFFRTGAIMIYQNQDWFNYSVDTIRDIPNKIDYKDIISLAIDPKNPNHIYAASCGDGLYEFLNHKLVKLYSYTNSDLETCIPNNYRYVRVDGLSFDKKGNLWMSNYLVNASIKVLKPDGTFVSLAYNELMKRQTISQIMQHSNGTQWIVLPRNIDECGLFVLDTNGDLEDKNGHKTKFFHSFTDTEGKTIRPNGVFCAVEDKKGEVWVGTDKGPLIFANPSQVFRSNYRCRRIKVALEDIDESSNGTVLASYLLDKEQLNCIVIDGGNRKWIGTETSGLYLLSEDGKKTIHHFTTENSPLPDNKILSLVIEPNTGELFIGTNKGLISFMSDATEGEPTFKNVYAFPNPVKPDFQGVVTITGLATNSQVMITDISGRKILETTSTGGRVTWDGKDKNGERVASGIYLVLCATETGEKGIATRIVMIKE